MKVYFKNKPEFFFRWHWAWPTRESLDSLGLEVVGQPLHPEQEQQEADQLELPPQHGRRQARGPETKGRPMPQHQDQATGLEEVVGQLNGQQHQVQGVHHPGADPGLWDQPVSDEVWMLPQHCLEFRLAEPPVASFGYEIWL